MKPAKKKRARSCVVCGCTDDRACRPIPCSWVTKRPPVCSGCVMFLMNIRDPSRFKATLEFFGISAVIDRDGTDGPAVVWEP